jgi:hypothetical protein
MTMARVVGVLLITASCLAFAESTAELVARAAAAKIDDQPGLYIKAAEQQLKAADKLYTEGKPEEAGPMINDLADYSGKAAAASMQSGKRLKHTEIDIRKMASRLRDLQHSLSYDDQAPVKAAVDKLEQLRTQLLSAMFAKKKK